MSASTSESREIERELNKLHAMISNLELETKAIRRSFNLLDQHLRKGGLQRTRPYAVRSLPTKGTE